MNTSCDPNPGADPSPAVHATALGALIAIVLRADSTLLEAAAQHLDRHPDALAHQHAAQLLRDDLAAFTQDRTA